MNLLPLIFNVVLLPFFFKGKRITLFFYLRYHSAVSKTGLIFLQDCILQQSFIHLIASIPVQIQSQANRVLWVLISISYHLLTEFFVFAFCQTDNAGNLDFRASQ